MKESENPSLVTRHPLLLKGVDPKKDQSYVLHILRREELARLVLPLGDMRKDKVRGIARKLGLASVDRPESQEICFIEERKYFKLVERLSDAHEGPLIDIESGKTLGSHKGIYRYTIGQRKRLGIAAGKPLYVVKIDPSKNAVYIGPKEKVMIKEFMVEDINWLVGREAVLKRGGSEALKYGRTEENCFHSPGYGLPDFRTSDLVSFRATVKVRSTMRDEPATVTVLDDKRARVIYDEPQWAPAPGQSAVFYVGDIVIGGGVIQ